jgi:hypothetical protein
VKIPKVEYFAVDFEFPPHGEQLTKEFGKDGWQITAMLPVGVQEEENGEVLNRIRCFFMRAQLPNPDEQSRIMVPK